jgi:integrase
MQAEYDIIRRARDLLATLPKSSANESTKAGYIRAMQRLFAGGRSVTTLIAAAMNTRKISTWFARKAAIKHASRDLVERLLHQQDQLQRVLRSTPVDDPQWAEWRSVVRSLGQWSTLLQTVHEAPAIPKEGRKNRHSKRQDMKGLPGDWRERIVERMPNYAPAVLVAAVAGCRPDELVTGVRMSIEGGKLVAFIQGSKSGEKSGQPWRRLYWSLDSKSALVQALVATINQEQVNEGMMVQIKNAKAFSGAMRSAGKRAWPTRSASLTPYCFRHQAAADMKASGGLSSGDISAALGHLSDVTKSTYGHYSTGHAGGVAPIRVDAARPVKIRQTSAASQRKTADIKTNRVRSAGRARLA